MNIIIKSENEIEEIEMVSKLIWAKYQKGFLICILLLFICCVFLLYTGFQDGYDFYSAYNINGIKQNSDIYIYNFSGFVGFGFSMLIFTILMLIVIFRQKSRFKKQIKLKLQRSDRVTERIIDSDFFEFKSNLSTRNHKWNAFESYREIKNYLFLNFYKKSKTYTEFINLNNLDVNQKRDFFNLLNHYNIEKEN